MAVGSFILALIRLVRYLLMYLERKTRNAQQNSRYARNLAVQTSFDCNLDIHSRCDLPVCSCIKSMFKVVHCMLFCFDRFAFETY